MSAPRLRIAFLVGKYDRPTEATIAAVCRMAGIEIVAVLVDNAPVPARRRWRNLRKNIRREGLSYIFYRLRSAVLARMEQAADRVIPRSEVEELLRAAFPDYGLDQLADRHGFKVFLAGDLNCEPARDCLRRSCADLGVVLGTRVLRRPTFSIPPMGCINLHKGAVPEFRGTPPGFWELYEGRETAGVTVHYVDDGLDTGDIAGSTVVAIHRKETPESLRAKLDEEGTRLLTETLEQIRLGTAQRLPQDRDGREPRSRPSRTERLELARRLPHWRTLSEGRQTVKLAVWLFLFYCGAYNLIRQLRRSSRGAILLYHRVNDRSQDVLTTSTTRFAEHLVALRRFYHVISTEDMVDAIARGEKVTPTSVAIHFDDCYRDVRGNAAALLAAAGIRATAFVSSGFVDTKRAFAHDETKSPHVFENFRSTDLRELGGLGVTVGAHTVNHADLGRVPLEDARVEVFDSKRQLEERLSQPVLLFSYPFGQPSNIRPEVREMIAAAGYRGLFSAYGGFIGDKTPLFDIPRFGVSSDHSPLALLMELEGLTLKGRA